MRNTLVLLAGYPGTGKTFLANLIINKFSEFQLLSPDTIKERNWDQFGFDSLLEKEKLIKKSWKDYYKELEALFQSKISVISDYPFSDKQKSKLEELVKKNNYQVITIRLTANLDVLFERQNKRDLDEGRHLGHILKKYHKGMEIYHNQADNLLDYDEFIFRCKTRGYDKFSLGTLFEIDVTNYEEVNYDALLRELEVLIDES